MVNRTLASGPIVWAGIIAATCLLLVLFQTILWLVMPVLLATICYYLLMPGVNMAMRWGWSRASAVFIVTVLLSLFLVGVGLFLFPKMANASHDWRSKLEMYLHGGSDLLAGMQQRLHEAVPILPTMPAPQPQSVGFVATNLPTTAPSDDLNHNVATLTQKYSTDILLEVLHWVPSLLLVPYLTYSFLLEGPRFKRFLVRAIPNAFFEKTLYLFYRVDEQFRAYFRGLLLLTALDGFCLGIGLWFLGLNAPFLLAGMAAFLAWLPYLGSIAGCLMVVLVAHNDAPHNDLLPFTTIGLFVIVRLCDDFIFLPLTVGRSLRMHPLVTILMILLGGAVAGISGLLLVLPLLGIVMVAGQIIGELLTDERILARHRHSRQLRRSRAQLDLQLSARPPS